MSLSGRVALVSGGGRGIGRAISIALAEDGAGLGAAWGVELATAMLEDAGFGSIRIERLPHDVQNAYFVVRNKAA